MYRTLLIHRVDMSLFQNQALIYCTKLQQAVMALYSPARHFDL